jgi:hypothetical protein
VVVTEGDAAVRFRGAANVRARNLTGRRTVPWPFGRLAIAADELTLTANLFASHELDLRRFEEHLAYPMSGPLGTRIGVGINAHDEIWFFLTLRSSTVLAALGERGFNVDSQVHTDRMLKRLATLTETEGEQPPTVRSHRKQ